MDRAELRLYQILAAIFSPIILIVGMQIIPVFKTVFESFLPGISGTMQTLFGVVITFICLGLFVALIFYIIYFVRNGGKHLFYE